MLERWLDSSILLDTVDFSCDEKLIVSRAHYIAAGIYSIYETHVPVSTLSLFSC